VTQSLTLETARELAAAAHAAAAEAGKSISVAVVDAAGRDVLVERSAGASWFTADVARSKAATAAALGRPSVALTGLREAYPELVTLIDGQLPRPLTSLPGGVPVLVDGVLVGAVAVSGATPEQDVVCAEAAAAALPARS